MSLERQVRAKVRKLFYRFMKGCDNFWWILRLFISLLENATLNKNLKLNSGLKLFWELNSLQASLMKIHSRMESSSASWWTSLSQEQSLKSTHLEHLSKWWRTSICCKRHSKNTEFLILMSSKPLICGNKKIFHRSQWLFSLLDVKYVWIFYFNSKITHKHSFKQTYRHPEWQGPWLGPKPSEENKREFDEETLAAGKTIIGLQAGQNKGASQSGQNMGAGRKIIIGK